MLSVVHRGECESEWWFIAWRPIQTVIWDRLQFTHTSQIVSRTCFINYFDYALFCPSNTRLTRMIFCVLAPPAGWIGNVMINWETFSRTLAHQRHFNSLHTFNITSRCNLFFFLLEFIKTLKVGFKKTHTRLRWIVYIQSSLPASVFYGTGKVSSTSLEKVHRDTIMHCVETQTSHKLIQYMLSFICTHWV